MIKKSLTLLSLLVLCAFPAMAQQKTLKIYNWSDYINPDVLAAFEKETGTKVIYDTFDTVELAETKLTAGKSGYDLAVVAATNSLPRLIALGILMRLDKSKIPNLKYSWPDIDARLQRYDPGNAYSVNYMWGTTGLGYDKAKIGQRLGSDTLSSWKVLFDPQEAAKLKDCGIYVLDAVEEIFPAALNYLGLNPDSRLEGELRKAADLLFSIRPSIVKFHSSEYINALANGDICMAIGYSGDILQAKNRATEAAAASGKKIDIAYSIPQEGAAMWFDNFIIPKDAENPDAAYAFIDFVNRPEMAAKNGMFIRYASNNLAAQKFLGKDMLNDPGIYPPPEVMKHLFTVTPYERKTQTALNRMWTNIKANRKPY